MMKRSGRIAGPLFRVMVMPGLVAYVSTFLIEPVFRKYQEKEE